MHIARSKWLPEVRHYIPDAHVVLLALKSDLKDTARSIVTYDEGYQLAKEEGTLLYIKTPNFGKNPCTIVHGFFQKMAPKSPPIFITFSYTY